MSSDCAHESSSILLHDVLMMLVGASVIGEGQQQHRNEQMVLKKAYLINDRNKQYLYADLPN